MPPIKFYTKFTNLLKRYSEVNEKLEAENFIGGDDYDANLYNIDGHYEDLCLKEDTLTEEDYKREEERVILLEKLLETFNKLEKIDYIYG